MYRVRPHVGLPREPFRAERALELGRGAALVDHVPAQQLLPVGPLVEVTATVRADGRVRRGAPLQQRVSTCPAEKRRTLKKKMGLPRAVWKNEKIRKTTHKTRVIARARRNYGEK